MEKYIQLIQPELHRAFFVFENGKTRQKDDDDLKQQQRQTEKDAEKFGNFIAKGVMSQVLHSVNEEFEIVAHFRIIDCEREKHQDNPGSDHQEQKQGLNSLNHTFNFLRPQR